MTAKLQGLGRSLGVVLFVLFAFCMVAALSSACDANREAMDNTLRDGVKYNVVKSPVTGHCYEIVFLNDTPPVSGIWHPASGIRQPNK